MFASRFLFPTPIIWELPGVELENSFKPVTHIDKVSNFLTLPVHLNWPS